MKRFALIALVLVSFVQLGLVAAVKKPARKSAPKASAGAAKKSSKTAVKPASKSTAAAKKPAAKTSGAKSSAKKAVTASVRKKKTPVRRYRPAPPVDPTIGDQLDGEDLAVRRAAVAALGTMNGSVVVMDPSNGRVLSIVNQKLAMKSGYIPCSTIKLVTGIAALSDGIIQRGTEVRLSRRTSFNLTTALAHSNNPFFQRLGNQLGYERVTHYARLLGLGEKAGLDIPAEEPGIWPESAPRYGGVGMMTAYGENIQVTPLELAAMVSAVANGGTLYHLQYPRSQEEIDGFEPKVKRELGLSPSALEDMKSGMRGAVDFGTARRAFYNPEEPILGKTGTCTDFRESNHMGWFGSFNEVDHHQLVVVVMLLGTKTVNGPVASGVAGAIYRALSEQRYFVAEARQTVDQADSSSPASTKAVSDGSW
jgi:penicillin-binding protein 2